MEIKTLEDIFAIPDIATRIEYLKKGRRTPQPDVAKLYADWNPNLHEIITDKAKYPKIKLTVEKGKTVFDEKLQTWNLGAAIAYASTGFNIIIPDNYKESWFTTIRIALIVAGGTVIVGLIFGLIIFCIVHKKKKNDYEPIGESVNDQIE